MNDLKSVLQFFASLGGTAVMVVFGYAVYSGRLVFRRELEEKERQLTEVKRDRDLWMETALRTAHITRDISTVTQRLVNEVAAQHQASTNSPKDSGA